MNNVCVFRALMYVGTMHNALHCTRALHHGLSATPRHAPHTLAQLQLALTAFHARYESHTGEMKLTLLLYACNE